MKLYSITREFKRTYKSCGLLAISEEDALEKFKKQIRDDEIKQTYLEITHVECDDEYGTKQYENLPPLAQTPKERLRQLRFGGKHFAKKEYSPSEAQLAHHAIIAGTYGLYTHKTCTDPVCAAFGLVKFVGNATTRCKACEGKSMLRVTGGNYETSTQ